MKVSILFNAICVIPHVSELNSTSNLTFELNILSSVFTLVCIAFHIFARTAVLAVWMLSFTSHLRIMLVIYLWVLSVLALCLEATFIVCMNSEYGETLQSSFFFGPITHSCPEPP